MRVGVQVGRLEPPVAPKTELGTAHSRQRRVEAARRGDGVSIVELITYRRKGHAEHDNQSYVPEGEIDRWATENDPLERYERVLRDTLKVKADELRAIDALVQKEIDDATDLAELSPMPEPLEALRGVYAHQESVEPLWFREDVKSAVDVHERAEGWGTYNG